MEIILVLILGDSNPGKMSEKEALNIMAGADGNMLLASGGGAEGTFDGKTEGASIIGMSINSTGTVSQILANDGNDTNVASVDDGLGNRKGYLNLAAPSDEPAVGTFFKAGLYQNSRSWNKVVTGTASVIVYYNYIPSRSKP